MRKIKTNDGSYTFLDSDIKEVYNPLYGAVKRANDVYVNQIDFAKYKKLRILDIGFGLGYNSLCVIEKCIQNNIKLEIFAIEKNSLILNEIESLVISQNLINSFDILKKGVKLKKLRTDNINFKLEVRNASNIVKNINDKFDVILLDPFSYVKNKELYGRKFLSDLKNLLDEEGFLVCHNSNPILLNNLIENKYNIKKYKIKEYEYGVIASSFLKLKLGEKDEKLAKAFGDDFKIDGKQFKYDEI